VSEFSAEAAGGGGTKIARAIPKRFGRQKRTRRDGKCTPI
jgi:hypothetical protein